MSLMQQSPGPKQSVWDDVRSSAGNTIDESHLPDPDKRILLSIVIAGAGCADRFYDLFPDRFERLGAVTFERALPFVEVFSLAMASRWVRKASDQLDLDRATMWQPIAENLLSLFGTSSERRYEEARLMDLQYNRAADAYRDGENRNAWEFAEIHLTVWLAERALGAKTTGALSSGAMPVNGTGDLWDRMGIEGASRDFEVLDEAWFSLASGHVGMNAAWKAIAKLSDAP